jgi:hypothetical protein
VLLDGAVRDDELLCDRVVRRPSAISPSTSRSRGVTPSSGSDRRRRPEQQRDDLRVERRAARRRRGRTGVDEPLDVADAVLEQVAEPAALVGEQLERAGGLVDVRGQDEHAVCGMALADLCGGAQALVGVRRRHAHVDDGDVGLVGLDLAQQVLGVAGLADDLHPRVLEQPRDAFAQERRCRRPALRARDLRADRGSLARRG